MNGENEEIRQKKISVVTGGVRGIGKAVAMALKERGYTVYALYSRDEKSAAQAQKEGLICVRADVRSEEEITAFFSVLKRVDVLVNNAGISVVAQLQDTTAEQFDDLYAVNVRGAFLCAREAAKKMISQKSGSIINVSSVWGEVGGSCESAYSATKGALLALTKALAKELGYSGIRVNSVSPGVIDTAMNARFSAEEIAALKEEIPLGRLGAGDDVAKAVLSLIDCEYVTGADVPVNGGFSVV
ncbi:MAG: SDR family oxidoreductase [Candidatus Borkfalkiaceae bacterium]|nr:SDR family oxidoreductase [Christensenellaceae bacterium]